MDQLSSIDGQWSVISPASKPRRDFYLPPVFEDKVMLHILKNNLRHITPPLILAIQGPKGEGKSSQTRELCSRLGIVIIALSGSSISGVHEKEPVLILQQAYLHASSIRTVRNQLAVILIDDLDTSVASVHEERRYTVNSQLVSGFLMNLADDPYHIGGRETHRIPIIVTGNDFTNLYEPLTRHGRSWFFNWQPDIEVKTQVLRQIFGDHMNPGDIDKLSQLIEQFPDESIAFYNEIRNDLYDPIILQMIRNGSIDLVHLENTIKVSRSNLSLDDLIALCEAKRNSVPQRFLANRSKSHRFISSIK